MSAFHLTPSKRVLVGHLGGSVVRLKLEDGSLSTEEVSNGESVAILRSTGSGNDHILVSRQDGVRGYVRVRHVHVQAWPLERTPVLAAASRHRFMDVSGQIGTGAFTVTDKCLAFVDGSRSHAIRVLGSHAFVVDAFPPLLFLLHVAHSALVAWDGQTGKVVAVAPVEGSAAAPTLTTNGLGVAAATSGWAGVFTWAAHENGERVGMQWTISDAGRTHARGSTNEAVSFITPHAFIRPGAAARIYVLDESGGQGQRAVAVLAPTASPTGERWGTTCLALPTTVAGLHGAAADAWKLVAGRSVTAGNVTHDGGATLLRRHAHASLEEANRTEHQIFDGDALKVIESPQISPGLPIPPNCPRTSPLLTIHSRISTHLPSIPRNQPSSSPSHGRRSQPAAHSPPRTAHRSQRAAHSPPARRNPTRGRYSKLAPTLPTAGCVYPNMA